MDSSSMNPYEQQLYSVFKTFDVDNEEALDKSAVLDLCDALQLEDRGTALVNTLFERQEDRVTFDQFRNGLLSVLSGASSASAADSAPPTVTPGSDEDSGREAAPKITFGSKKYGRRSRPHRSSAASSSSPRAASVSRLDAEDRRNRSMQHMRCSRSVSVMESRDINSDDGEVSPDRYQHNQQINCEQALALCQNLNMDGIDPHLIGHVFQDLDCDKISVGDFFNRLNASLTSSIEGSRVTLPECSVEDDVEDEDCRVSLEEVVDAWERTGVQRPRRLLSELGFATASVRPPDLERAIDLELAAAGGVVSAGGVGALWAAALGTSRLGAGQLLASRRRVIAERDKLRNDVADTNRRAALLAHEVDEAHARLEAELSAELRRAETRAADAARVAAEEAAAERDRDAAMRIKLETEIARRTESENRLREDLNAERKRLEQLESRTLAAENQAAAAEKELNRLLHKEREIIEKNKAEHESEDMESSALAVRLEEQRLEIQQLRDRNDELCGLLEARAGTMGTDDSTTGDGTCGALASELKLLLPSTLEECDPSLTSINHKLIMDYNDAVRQLKSIFETIRDVNTEDRKLCDSCSDVEKTLSDLRSRARELCEAVVMVGAEKDVSEMGVQADLGPSQDALSTAEKNHQQEKQKYTELIQDLELSLEQMRDEYERCEEYWSQKLEDERNEYEEERRAGDQRLAELAARVVEYERAFVDVDSPDSSQSSSAPPRPAVTPPTASQAPPPAAFRQSAASPASRLPPIEERSALEAQVADLERECAEHRARTTKELQAKDEELSRLRRQLEEYGKSSRQDGGRQDGGKCVSQDGGCACAWCARGALAVRTARAEAAVHRLAQRLRTADLLVKDLYVENCHLARVRV